MVETLSRFKFDLDKANLNFEKELKCAMGSEYDMKLYDKLMELYDTPFAEFELWSLLQKSRYNYNYSADEIHADFRVMLDFLDFIHAVIYDSVDDGEIRLVKLETVGKQIKFKGKDGKDIVHACEDTKFFIVNSELCCDSTSDDVAWLKNSYDEDLERFGLRAEYDHLKISHRYLGFDDVIKVLDTIIKWALSKQKAISEYAKKNGLTESDVLNNFKHEYEACKDVNDLDLTGVVPDWHVIDNVK